MWSNFEMTVFLLREIMLKMLYGLSRALREAKRIGRGKGKKRARCHDANVNNFEMNMNAYCR